MAFEYESLYWSDQKPSDHIAATASSGAPNWFFWRESLNFHVGRNWADVTDVISSKMTRQQWALASTCSAQGPNLTTFLAQYHVPETMKLSYLCCCTTGNYFISISQRTEFGKQNSWSKHNYSAGISVRTSGGHAAIWGGEEELGSLEMLSFPGTRGHVTGC